MICYACRQPGASVTRKVSPILPGWPKGWGERSPAMGDFHADCYRKWHREVYADLAELDRSLNEAAGFERYGNDPTYGQLVCQGEKYPCRSWWRGDEMEQAYPQLKGRAWWTPRKGGK